MQSVQSMRANPVWSHRSGLDAMTTTLISILAMLVLNVALIGSVVVLRLRVTHRNQARASVTSRWLPRIHQLLAGETSANTLHPLVRRSDRTYLVELATQCGQRVSGIELDRLRSLGRPFLGSVDRSLSSQCAETRARAVQVIGILGGEKCADRLVAALDDKSPLVAMVAATALSGMGNRELSAEQYEVTLGWRPSVDQEIPRRPHWVLTDKIGDGGFGEVYTARQTDSAAGNVQ